MHPVVAVVAAARESGMTSAAVAHRCAMRRAMLRHLLEWTDGEILGFAGARDQAGTMPLLLALRDGEDRLRTPTASPLKCLRKGRALG